jgi:hypothetical protein
MKQDLSVERADNINNLYEQGFPGRLENLQQLPLVVLQTRFRKCALLIGAVFERQRVVSELVFTLTRRMAQVQQMKLQATNLLMCSIQMNALIGNMEVASGLLPASDEDKEVEDDDG